MFINSKQFKIEIGYLKSPKQNSFFKQKIIMSKVFFYLCPRETATKVHTFTTESGESLNKTKVGSNVANVYRVLQSVSTGRLKTGLNELVDNPYVSLSKDKIKSGFEPYIFEKEKVKLQHLLEYKHGVSPNEYSDAAPAKLVAGKDDTADTLYFHRLNSIVKITDKGLPLDLNNPEDEIKYYWLKASDKCAPSRDKIKKGIHEYFIGSEFEDEELKINKMQLIDKAIFELMNPELSDEVKEKIAKKLDVVSKENSSKKVYSALRLHLTDNHKDQKERVTEFLRIVQKLEDPVFRERLNAEVLLKDLVDYFIISNKSETYEWKSKGIKLGFSKAEAIDFLLHPKKQEEVEKLETELKNKKS